MTDQELSDYEINRLRALREYNILDTEPEECFDDLAKLASQICQTPFAGVSLVDRDRLFFKSRIGFDTVEIPRAGTFCSRAIEQREIFIVQDLLQYSNEGSAFSSARELGLRFYAGVPIVNTEGYELGNLFVLATTPRELVEEQKSGLNAIARQVAAQFSLRRKVLTLENIIDQLDDYSTELLRSQERYRSVVDNVKEVIFQTDTDGRWLFLNPAWTEVTGFSVTESLGEPSARFIHPQDKSLNRKRFAPLYRGEKEYCRHEVRYITKDGGFRWLEIFAKLTTGHEGKFFGTSGTLIDITERKLAEQSRKREKEYVGLLQDATAAANQAESVEEAMRICLRRICEVMGWSIGHVFRLNETGTTQLESTRIWHTDDSLSTSAFVDATATLTSTALEELPGRAVLRKKAVWSSELSNEDWFARRESAQALGLRGGFAFPVIVGNEISAVLEFFSTRIMAPDERFLEILENVGMQIGRVVERKRAEDKTRRLLGELADINLALDASTIVTITDKAGTIMHANEKFCEISGYARDELIGQNHRLINSGQHPRMFFDDMWNTLHLGHIWHGEIRNRDKEGQLFWVDTTIIPFLDDQRKPYQHIAISIDVTKRKNAEEALRESEGRFRAISEASPLGIFLLDPDNRCVYFNHRFQQIAGWNGPDLLGWKWLKTVHPDDVARLTPDWVHRVRTGEFTFEYRHVQRDGKIIWANANSAPIFVNDEITGYVGIIEDITTRKAMEQALRESEARYRVVAETASDAILTIDTDSTILFVNSAAEQIFGYKRKEMEGQKLMMLMPEDLQQSHGDAARNFRGTGEKQTAWRGVEIPAVRKDGQKIVIEISFGEFKDAETHIFTGIIRDITERIRIAGELQQAKEDAEAATRAKSQFLANMSHEIRTPMNSIIGLSNLMLEYDLPDDQHDLMETVCDSAESLLTIINDILDFSKIEAGKLELEIRDFDLKRTITEVCNLFSQQAIRGSTNLHFAVASELPTIIRGDSGRLRQILTNLVGNALKFTNAGQVAIKVDLRSVNTNDLVVHFEVSDTGVGISADQKNRLFKAFSQADGSINRRFGGTGLGLAICRQLAEMMSGEIGVESEPGEGSTFWFTARFERSNVEKVAARSKQNARLVKKRRPKIAISAAETSALRILVADDNAVNRKVALLMLGKLGYTAEFVCNGKEVLQALDKRPFDIVFMDVQMPEMDGLETARRICREWPRERRPRIVAMTANAMCGDRDECLAAGMNDYLSKPIRKDDLSAVLENCGPVIRDERPANGDDTPMEVDVLDMTMFRSLEEFSPESADEIIAELIGIFVEEAPKSLDLLRSAISAGDFHRTERAAHSLKGSCATIGAAKTASLCAQLERSAFHGEMSGAALILKSIETELKVAMEALEHAYAVK